MILTVQNYQVHIKVFLDVLVQQRVYISRCTPCCLMLPVRGAGGAVHLLYLG